MLGDIGVAGLLGRYEAPSLNPKPLRPDARAQAAKGIDVRPACFHGNVESLALLLPGFGVNLQKTLTLNPKP